MRMYQRGIKYFLVFASFILAFTLVSTPISAAQNKIDNTKPMNYNERVKKFEKAFEFIYEEAAILDKNGNVIDFNFEVIRDKYGNSEALNMLENEINARRNHNSDGIQTAGYWGCMKSAMFDYFGVNAVQAAINGGIANYIKKKAWKEAAKLAAKYFVGTTVAGLISTFIYFSGKCLFFSSANHQTQNQDIDLKQKKIVMRA